MLLLLLLLFLLLFLLLGQDLFLLLLCRSVFLGLQLRIQMPTLVMLLVFEILVFLPAVLLIWRCLETILKLL